MKLYCMSDIHGCLAEFEEALSLVEERLDEDNVRLILLRDYIHGGADNNYDGASHYYIDGTVLKSGRIPVLKVDTETDQYYRVTEGGDWLILPMRTSCT